MWLNWYFDGDQAQAERKDLLSSATGIEPTSYSVWALEGKTEKVQSIYGQNAC